MRVLFTGGSGKAGRHVVAYLAAAGHRVLNFDRVGLGHPGVHDLLGDITDAGQVYSAMRTHAGYDEMESPAGAQLFDAVVHFAAVPRHLMMPDTETYRVNVMGTYNVLEAALKMGIGKVIIASSETTYGVCFSDGEVDPKVLPLEEDYDIDPMDSYGMSKKVNEVTARSFQRRFGADVYALRIGNVIEPHEYATVFPPLATDPGPRRRITFSYIDARDPGVSHPRTPVGYFCKEEVGRVDPFLPCLTLTHGTSGDALPGRLPAGGASDHVFQGFLFAEISHGGCGGCETPRVCRQRLRRLGHARDPHLLERGTRLACLQPCLYGRKLTQQGRVALRVAQAFGGVHVGDGEAVTHKPRVRCKVRLKPRQRAAQFLGPDRYGGLAFGGLVAAGPGDVQNLQRWAFDRRHGQQCPLVDQGVFGSGLRAEVAAMCAGDVVGDGKAFGQRQVALDIGRDLAQRVDLEERGRGGVQGRIGGRGLGQPVGLDHRHMGERQVKFVKQPDRARGAAAKDAVEGDHCGILHRDGQSLGARSGKVKPALHGLTPIKDRMGQAG